MFRVLERMRSVGQWALGLTEGSYWLLPERSRIRKGTPPVVEIRAQLERFSVGLIPLLAVVLGFVGMILGLQMATILKDLGAPELLPEVVGVSMIREMAPLLVGVVLAGFAGAAVAAEVASMKVSRELTALKAIALPPSRFLLAPRLIAVAIAAPLVTGVGFQVGLLGSLVVADAVLGIAPGHFVSGVQSAVRFSDVFLGLTKGFFFALAVVSIAWFEGNRARGGARGVGKATTATVVHSVVAVITLDLLLTVAAYRMGGLS